jgi:formamidopyrimidine-DNA glycosylase
MSSKEVSLLKEKYGPDLIIDKITPEQFLQRLKLKKTAVKNALLEQSLVAGLGNIYVTDALWLSKIHPTTRTTDLALNHAKILLKSAVDILTEGIKHRGSTLADKAYVDVFGRIGNHQNYFRIYGKTNCPACRNKIVYVKLNGRGTYFCPSCQK